VGGASLCEPGGDANLGVVDHMRVDQRSALPDGAIRQKFGDKATVLGALLLMLAGSVVLPLVGTGYGVGAVHLAVAASILCGIVLLAITQRPPANSALAATTILRLDRNTAIAVLCGRG
jgi:hypothetical protein